MRAIRVLLVDDEAIARRVYSRALELGGCEVRTVCDGAEALDALGSERFDVVVCDQQMPRLDGDRVLEAMRADPAWRDLPFVLMSSHVDERLASIVEDDPAAARFDKPASAKLLLELIQEMLR